MGLFDLLNQGAELRAPIKPLGHNDPDWAIMGTVNLYSGHLYHPDDIEVDLPNILLAGTTADVSAYWRVPSDDNPAPFSFLGSFASFCSHRGKDLVVVAEMIDFGKYIGQTVIRERRTNGERLVFAGLRITLENAS
ncbi:MAG: hypothetical protein EOO82_02680 [Oxalobacteraceae bacterium]|nr:MAG: hypothetical protein EOO82_02680 [Oxalobacteraceae bacterium]